MLIKFEEEFDKEFDPQTHWQGDNWVTDKVKTFITSLLQKQEEETRKQVYKELQDEGKI